MKKKSESKQRCLYLPKSLDKELVAFAESEELPVSYVVRIVLARFLKKKGVKLPKWQGIANI